MGGKSGGGESADVVGGAQETGQQARQLNEAQTIANRPDQFNEFGSTQWANSPQWDAATGQYVNRWTQTSTMDPAEKARLENQRSQDAWLDNAANYKGRDALVAMHGTYDADESRGEIQGMDESSGELRQRSEDAAYGRSTSRLDPQYQQREEALMSRLRSQGLGAGDTAYDRAIGNFNRDRSDSYEQARMGATGEGRVESGQEFDQSYRQTQLANQLRSQGIGEDLMERNMPWEEFQRLQAGRRIEGQAPAGA